MLRSQVAPARSNWFMLRGETPSLGMISATDPIVCVGAALRAVGARAKTRAMVFVKIIVAVSECDLGDSSMGAVEAKVL